MISGDPTDAPTCSEVRTPEMGKTAIGNNEVTGMGSGSKIHHNMHSHATTAVITIASGCPNAAIMTARHNPDTRPGQILSRGSRKVIVFISCMLPNPRPCVNSSDGP